MDFRDTQNVFDSIKGDYDLTVDSLKTEQLDVITAILNGKDVFALLPTGFGKSMCYLLPPLLLNELNWSIKHVVFVISPLISLMKDQVSLLTDMKISSAYIAHDISPEVVQGIKSGAYTIIFSSPEAIVTPFWRKILLSKTYTEENKICLLCMDEVHCISELGDDFRPDYKKVNELRSIVDVPLLLLTATCTEKMQKDIYRTLAVSDIHQVAVLPDRPNIYIDFQKITFDASVLNWIILNLKQKGTEAHKTIIYCRSVTQTAELFCEFMDQLIDFGMEGTPSERLVEMFHRNIDTHSNDRIMNEFKKKDSIIRCLISTVAFGMGVQINDVRIVVHWGAPKNIPTYWQEVGRAGRDGLQSLAICYAYGQSLSKVHTDEAVRDLNKESCLRRQILCGLLLKGMDNILPRKECAKEICTIKCACEKCLCCSVCSESCNCKNKEKFAL